MRTQLKIYYFCNCSFPCGSAGKESACNARVPGFDPWVGKIPWRRERLPTSVSWPGEFHRPYNQWGHKQLDRTERLSLSLFCNYMTFLLNNLYDSFWKPSMPLVYLSKVASLQCLYLCTSSLDRKKMLWGYQEFTMISL